MLRKAVIFFPFFYFQQTRLKSLRDVAFHGVYEWVPAIGLLSAHLGVVDALLSFFIYYFSFIAVYEIGYLANDQTAFRETDGRPRSEKLSVTQIAFFVAARILVFFALTFFTIQADDVFWFSWYALLLTIFAIHTLINSLPLKVISFSFLAFARFFSPFIFGLPTTITGLLVLPVFLNYVLFRSFTYMDSKNLLLHFDRKSLMFRLGFYFLILPFSIALSLLHNSWLPLLFNGYFIMLGLGYSLAIHK